MMDLRLEKACHEVYHSDFILELILKNLDLNEQVNLLDVSQRFVHVLTKCIWAKMYLKLNLYKTRYAIIVTTRETEEACRQGWQNWHAIDRLQVALSRKQCKDFLVLHAESVTTLRVFSEYYYYENAVGVSFKNMKFFMNLSELCFSRLQIDDEQMQIISQSCKKLQKFHLLECYNEYLKPLVPGEHLNLLNIYEMKNLQELVIESDPLAESVLKSYHIQEILLNLKLKKFILKNFTINDNDADTMLPLSNSLEQLNCGLMSMRFWPSFLHYLQHFENLIELHINVSDCNTALNIQVMDILATKCRRLEKLSLEKCDLSVEDFGVLKSLKHLSLTACGGLTFANFQQIFGALKLTTFAFINTRIFGTINHIYVSPSLEEIVIDTIRFTHISDVFQKSLNKFENLHTLKWLNGDINDNWIIDKCPKLKYLHIPNPYLLRRIVFTMKSLKELTFTSCKGLSWCFILILIRNLTLERLCLQTSETITDDNEMPFYACGIQTTLKLIIMPSSIFKVAQSFWIDLLRLHENLRYSIYGAYYDIFNADFLEELLSDKKFCSRVKRWQICGFRYDCQDLLNNFNNFTHQLYKLTTHHRTKNANISLEM